MAEGGSGLTFEVVQSNSVRAKPGGPLIGVRDSADPTRVVAEVDEFSANAIVSQGAVTADAFWMEMRLSPGTEQAPDFGASAFFSKVLERGGVIWRDQGDGWYETDGSPGTGMDPVRARLLPRLLRSMTDVVILRPRSATAGCCRVSAVSGGRTTIRASWPPTARPSPRRRSRSPAGSTSRAGSCALRRPPTTVPDG